jgi:Tfp pilus assembly protein PilF
MPDKQPSQFANVSKRARRIIIAALMLASLCLVEPLAAPGKAQQGSFIIFGHVNLPNGARASRVKVKIEGLNGLNREVQTDDQGRYEFQGVPGGRYRLTATNPADATQFTDPVAADTTQSFAGRLQVDIHLRIPPATAKAEAKPGTISVAEATQQVPKKARQAYEQGLKAKGKNQLDRALASFNEAVKLYPDFFQAITERAELQIKRNQIEAAVEDFARALKIHPEHGPALRGAGYCKLEQRAFAEAIEYLERAIAIEPEVANTHLSLGFANLNLDRREPARQALLQALRLDPRESVRAHVYLADLFAREQRYAEAANELRTYLALEPDAPDAEKLKALEAQLRARTVPKD